MVAQPAHYLTTLTINIIIRWSLRISNARGSPWEQRLSWDHRQVALHPIFLGLLGLFGSTLTN